MMTNQFTHRYIARIILEASTPLFVGSGESSLLTDSLVHKDANGLPMIPGTALTGVLRHSLEDYNNEFDWREIFGFQHGDEGLGSRLKLSSGYLLMGNGKVAEGLNANIDSELLQRMTTLPTRQHVRINERGVAAKNGLFDNEVVYKGARFIFEIELKGSMKDQETWNKILNEFSNPFFRIGQGTRNGYGLLQIISIYQRNFDLKKEDDFLSYLSFDPSLNEPLKFVDLNNEGNAKHQLSAYKLMLSPDNFFIFSQGFGDDLVDNKPVTEQVMIYDQDTIRFEQQTVIPASSIKGALSHRVCYHYNKLQGWFAESGAGKTGEENPAIYWLFGSAGSQDLTKEGRRGILIFNDLYYNNIKNDKILNHLAIDRFTGGAMDGALFSESVSWKEDGVLELEIYLVDIDLIRKQKEAPAQLDFNNVKMALQAALEDICKGLLPLGGMTTKGHGMFTGSLYLDNEKIFSYGT